MQKNENWVEGQRVKIHSFGDNKEHTGTVCGINCGIPDLPIYIIRLDEGHPWPECKYSCVAMLQCCLTAI